MIKTNLEKLRKEALELLKKDENNLVFRSCWNCNAAHEHLKEEKDVVIHCFECGKYYYKGFDVTVYED